MPAGVYDGAVHGAVYMQSTVAVCSAVCGAVCGAVHGAVYGAVYGTVYGAVYGTVYECSLRCAESLTAVVEISPASIDAVKCVVTCEGSHAVVETNHCFASSYLASIEHTKQ